MTKDEIFNNPLVVPHGYKYVSNSGFTLIQDPDTGAEYKFLEFEDTKNDGPNKFCARLMTEATVVGVPVDKETHWSVNVDIAETPGLKKPAKNAVTWIGNSYAEKIIENGGKMEEVFTKGTNLQTELFIRMDENGRAWSVSNSSVMGSGFEFADNSDFLMKTAKSLATSSKVVEETTE